MTDKIIPARDLPTPPVITLASRCSVGAGVRFGGAGAPASGANPYAANDMLAYPIVLSAPTYVNKAFWTNGSSAGGNYSVGVYDADFRLLVQSASTGGSGTNAPQSVAMVVKLSVGLYYLAMAHDSTTTNRMLRFSLATIGASWWKSMGCWRQASVTLASLPNPATPVACNNIAFPMFGIITRTVFDV